MTEVLGVLAHLASTYDFDFPAAPVRQDGGAVTLALDGLSSLSRARLLYDLQAALCRPPRRFSVLYMGAGTVYAHIRVERAE